MKEARPASPPVVPVEATHLRLDFLSYSVNLYFGPMGHFVRS
jgi:hypothetical protein